MFNHPRDTNYNPNDNTNRTQAVLRWVGWSALVHPAGVAASLVVLVLGSKVGAGFGTTIATVLLVLPVEAVALRLGVGPAWLVRWAEMMRFRRRWFPLWTSVVKAQNDHTIQTGGLRPILSIFGRIDGTIVTWSIRPPAGQTLADVAELADVIAAHSPPVDSVEVVYRKPTDSKGQLVIVFGDSLTDVASPNWTPTPQPYEPKPSPGLIADPLKGEHV